jgi:predicted ferric reductase
MHELFVKTHSILAVGIIVLLLLHIQVLNTYVIVCITIAASIYLLQKLTWLLHFVYRNVGFRPTSRAAVTRGEILQIEVKTKRPWSVVPGQFIYLSIPRLRSLGLGFWESHPFLVAWVPQQDEGRASTIILLVQGYRGFTRRLQNANADMSALIDGPYGGLEADSFTKHDKILLMSDGIGIAAHLYTAQYLLRAHVQKTARVRRLTVVWVLQSQGIFLCPTH